MRILSQGPWFLGNQSRKTIGETIASLELEEKTLQSLQQLATQYQQNPDHLINQFKQMKATILSLTENSKLEAPSDATLLSDIEKKLKNPQPIGPRS